MGNSHKQTFRYLENYPDENIDAEVLRILPQLDGKLTVESEALNYRFRHLCVFVDPHKLPCKKSAQGRGYFMAGRGVVRSRQEEGSVS